jgi:hypothetical protein
LEHFWNMSGEPTFDRRNPMHRFLFRALATGYLVGAIVVTLGVAYAWLWFLLLAVMALGVTVGSIVGVVSLLWLVWRFRLGREPMFSWYQPWDHSYWILAARLSFHSWQRSANGEAR